MILNFQGGGQVPPLADAHACGVNTYGILALKNKSQKTF